MQDYVSVAAAALSAAISSATAVTVETLSDRAAMMSVDNGFDKDIVVMVGAAKPLYVRAGQVKPLSLSANNASIPAKYAIKLYGPNGAPATGVCIIDSMM